MDQVVPFQRDAYLVVAEEFIGELLKRRWQQQVESSSSGRQPRGSSYPQETADQAGACSSGGESTGLISRVSWVQVPPGPLPPGCWGSIDVAYLWHE